ncbi:MAG TPA: hypothetical protein VM286_05600 [Candidatus Thermoplasmatota archaeon]|nr:hypothetical protein [Candidatus Thermoplasmatota archaeon]
MRAACVLLVASLLASGCLYSAPGRNDPQPCPPDTYRLGPGACGQYHTYALEVFGFGEGDYSVGVPLPHGSWCLQPEQWVLRGDADNAVAELRQADRGTVMWITAHGSSHIGWRINVTDVPACQPIRHDPWSIEPDPADGRVEVQAEGAARITVAVSEPDGACAPVTHYAGNVTAGWTPLPQVFQGTSCA